MNFDHYAFRTRSRKNTSKLLMDLLDYKIQDEFEIKFSNNTAANCIALEPLDGVSPEIFCSDGDQDSIVGEWVRERNGGGIHHIAVRCDPGTIEQVIEEWIEYGIEFSSDSVIECPGLKQIFTKPILCLGGMIYELIERETVGFCRDSVKRLMEMSKK